VHGILGLVGLLEESEVDPRERDLLLKSLRSCGGMLLRLVDSVLDLGAIEASRLRLHPARAQVHLLAQRCFDLLCSLARQKAGGDIKCQLRIDEDVPLDIVVDEVRLCQVLVNLLGNAVKYTQQGHIFLRLGRGTPSGMLRFEVEDSGPGIAPTDRGKLFLPYELLRPSKGTGLGLSLAQHIIRLMGVCDIMLAFVFSFPSLALLSCVI
jgi:signal transduction histidine kinase